VRCRCNAGPDRPLDELLLTGVIAAAGGSRRVTVPPTMADPAIVESRDQDSDDAGRSSGVVRILGFRRRPAGRVVAVGRSSTPPDRRLVCQPRPIEKRHHSPTWA